MPLLTQEQIQHSEFNKDRKRLAELKQDTTAPRYVATYSQPHTTEVAGKTLEPCATTAIQPQGAALHDNNTATTAQAHTQSHHMTSTDY